LNIPRLPNFAQVSPELYRGARPTNDGLKYLADIGVIAVIDLQEWYDFAWLERFAVRKMMYYEKLSCNPWHPELEDVRYFLSIIGEAEACPVFVHCRQGCDRTGQMVACYRIAVQGWSADDAIAELYAFGYHANLYPEIETFIRGFKP
jgi:protein tyrosine/serine phosphatase